VVQQTQKQLTIQQQQTDAARQRAEELENICDRLGLILIIFPKPESLFSPENFDFYQYAAVKLELYFLR
jgi:hypothetical protein